MYLTLTKYDTNDNSNVKIMRNISELQPIYNKEGVFGDRN